MGTIQPDAYLRATTYQPKNKMVLRNAKHTREIILARKPAILKLQGCTYFVTVSDIQAAQKWSRPIPAYTGNSPRWDFFKARLRCLWDRIKAYVND